MVRERITIYEGQQGRSPSNQGSYIPLMTTYAIYHSPNLPGHITVWPVRHPAPARMTGHLGDVYERDERFAPFEAADVDEALRLAEEIMSRETGKE